MAQASTYFQRAIELTRAAFGAQHPHTAYALVGYADLAAVQGRYEEGARYLTQSLRIMQALSGPWHPHAVRLEIAIASMETRIGRYRQAEARLARLAPHMGPEGPSFSFDRRLAFYSVRGQHRRHRGQYRKSTTDLTTALQLAEVRWGKTSPKLVGMLLRLGSASVWGGDHTAALRYVARAEGLLQRLKRPRPLRLFWAARVRALALAGAGRISEATPALRKVLALRRQGLGSSLDEGRVRFALARVLWRQAAHRKEALEMGQAAHRVLADSPAHVQAVKGAVARWIASPR